MRVLITGASGFVGRAVLNRLSTESNLTLIAGTRQAEPGMLEGYATVTSPELGSGADWSAALASIDAIIHCAGLAHQTNRSREALSLVNVDGTHRLAAQAIEMGVRRFIFVSSIAVNGLSTSDRPFAADDMASPATAFGISKHRAELGLWRLSQGSDMRLTVVRPPLVYGRDAPGNLSRLAKLVSRGIPLPFGSVRNARTLVSVNNLADLLASCLLQDAAAGQTFLAGDAEDVSTPQIIGHIARGLGRRACLLPAPPALSRGLLDLLGQRSMAQQLFGSLQVDGSKAAELLGWIPPESPETAEWS